MTDILCNCWAEDIHGNRFEWVQRFPIDTEESKQFWESIG